MRLWLLLTLESLLLLNQYRNMFPSGEENPANVIKGYLDKVIYLGKPEVQLGEDFCSH